MDTEPAIRHNLPPQPTSFIGREAEIAAITALLDDPACRLLTLVGPGGIGKTRLALEVAHHRLNDFLNGVFFVPLQPLTSHENIVPTIATAIDLKLEGRDPKQSLLDFLREKSVLLLMDNFEHLLAEVDLLMEILKTARNTKLLVTSRAALNIRDEWLRPIQGLPVPTDPFRDDIESYDAVQLFLDRAHRVRPDFSIAREREALVALCQLVEGMPLALELAASWLKVLPCREIVTEIRQNREFLATRLRDVPERHSSLQAVFEHSWHLLTDEERDAFRKLSVFQGGCRREAAQQVAGASLPMLSILVDKSLLQMTAAGRYEMHELLRQFGQQKLDEVPEVKTAVLDRHCEFYAGFLHQYEASLHGPEWTSVLNEIEAEINNVRAAWSRAVEQRRVDLIQQALRSLHQFYIMRDWHQEGESAFGRAAIALNAHPPDGPSAVVLGHVLAGQGAFHQWLGQKDRAMELLQDALRIMRKFGTQSDQAQVLSWLGWATYFDGEFEQARAWVQESLSLATAIGEKPAIAYLHLLFCFILMPLGHYQAAKQAGQESLKLFRQLGGTHWVAVTTRTLGALLCKLGEYREAEAFLQDALALFESYQTRGEIANTLENLGSLNHALGAHELARERLERSLDIGREINLRRRMIFTLVRLGELACGLGEYDEARERFQESIAISSASGEVWQHVLAVGGLGRVAYHQKDYDEAQRLQQQSLALCKKIGYRLGIAHALKDLGLIATTLDKKREARHYFYQVLLEGTDIGIPPLILDTLVGIAELLMTEGQHVHAIELLALSANHPASHADTRATARNLLAELESRIAFDEFASAQQRGKKKELSAVVEDLLVFLSSPYETANRAVLDNSLTKREREVVRLMASDLSYPAIADLLHISPNTIKAHRSNIYDKLNVHSRDEAVMAARTLGLL